MTEKERGKKKSRVDQFTGPIGIEKGFSMYEVEEEEREERGRNEEEEREEEEEEEEEELGGRATKGEIEI